MEKKCIQNKKIIPNITGMKLFFYLWEPSQKGSFLVTLQAHKYFVSFFSAINTFGLIPVPLCFPSHNGWFSDNPQVHQAYFFPFSNSTGKGPSPALLGNSMFFFI